MEYVGFFSSPRMHQLQPLSIFGSLSLDSNPRKSVRISLSLVARGRGDILIDRATKIGWIWGGVVPHRKIRTLLARDEGKNADRQK